MVLVLSLPTSHLLNEPSIDRRHFVVSRFLSLSLSLCPTPSFELPLSVRSNVRPRLFPPPPPPPTDRETSRLFRERGTDTTYFDVLSATSRFETRPSKVWRDT